jgi:CheY-like chemotaxis protein
VTIPLAETPNISRTATIQGGLFDMSVSSDLNGRKVLVVEDDYYAASDTASALREAGAVVLGPCPSEAATLALLERELPDAAVLDLNLEGTGPQFRVAELLTEKNIPFLFVTGYDQEVIPAQFADIVRLQKPSSTRQVVEEVARL